MFLDSLTQGELVKFENIGRLKTFRPGDNLIVEGAVGTSFGMIISGKAEVRKCASDGGFRSLAELSVCDVIGELGFFGVESRSASVVALTECEYLEFFRADVEALVEAHPQIGLKIYRGMAVVLAERLASNDQSLMDAAFWARAEDKSGAAAGGSSGELTLLALAARRPEKNGK